MDIDSNNDNFINDDKNDKNNNESHEYTNRISTIIMMLLLPL